MSDFKVLSRVVYEQIHKNAQKAHITFHTSTKLLGTVTIDQTALNLDNHSSIEEAVQFVVDDLCANESESTFKYDFQHQSIIFERFKPDQKYAIIEQILDAATHHYSCGEMHMLFAKIARTVVCVVFTSQGHLCARFTVTSRDDSLMVSSTERYCEPNLDLSLCEAAWEFFNGSMNDEDVVSIDEVIKTIAEHGNTDIQSIIDIITRRNGIYEDEFYPSATVNYEYVDGEIHEVNIDLYHDINQRVAKLKIPHKVLEKVTNLSSADIKSYTDECVATLITTETRDKCKYTLNEWKWLFKQIMAE